jgi:cytochrome c-type biogenesis protein CcmH/NrfF
MMRQADSTYVAATTTPPVARAIISSSMSPFCPGLTLETCPSPSADSLRQVIIARVQRGDARARIEADLEHDFGAAIRSTPKAEGFGLVGWSVPGLVMLVAAVVLTRWIRRRVVVP